MIELKDIEFSYKKNSLPALSGITAVIEPGIHLLAGENGAGKTTLLHILAGLVHTSKGVCRIDGINPCDNNPNNMGKTFLIEENMFFPGKSIRDFARIHSGFYPRFSEEKFENNLRAFGLCGNESFKFQSLGNRKKSQLSYALALGVDVLLLDEPTNGLDIQSKNVLKSLLISCADESQTIIVATHSPAELENLFDGAVMLTRSRLLFAGSEEAVTRKLAFRVSRMPDTSALYSEIQVGRVLGIYAAERDSDTTKIDWRLLYSALHSPNRDKVLKAIIDNV